MKQYTTTSTHLTRTIHQLEHILELAATRIRRNRFGDPKYDQDQTFPVTRRLADAAFPDLRPKNHVPQETRR